MAYQWFQVPEDKVNELKDHGIDGMSGNLADEKTGIWLCRVNADTDALTAIESISGVVRLSERAALGMYNATRTANLRGGECPVDMRNLRNNFQC